MADEKSLVENLFTGKWTIKSLASNADSSPATARVEPSKGAAGYMLELYDAQGRKVSVSETMGLESRNSLILEFDSSDYTLCSETCWISLWRSAFYDVIFALHKNLDGEIAAIWSAQRASVPHPCPQVRDLTDRNWEIQEREGGPAARGVVRLKQCGQYFSACSYVKDSNELVLYDVLVYDGSVKSFNSIFGFRSLEYRRDDECPDDAFVLATFNSRLLSIIKGSDPKRRSSYLGTLPEEIREVLPSKIHHRLGCFMDFEDPDNDPDIGVWVGTPPT
ncbi:MAG: hypothetical protein AAF560_13415 [Acidobacteriota bacterium]